MALALTLVYAGPNRLRYLGTNTGGGGTATITSTGGATPDLITDSLQGPIKKLSKVVADGFGAFAAGAQTQAKARALWLSDWSGADPATGDPSRSAALANGYIPRTVNSLITTAICRVSGRTTGANLISVDANVDESGNPVITVVDAAVAAGNIYLDVFVPEAIG